MSGEDERSGEAQGPASDADLARRLDRLSHALDTGKRGRADESGPRRSSSADYSLAFRLASEFIAGVIVGAALGWALDWAAGTSPWGLIVLLMLGFLAGVVNVIRSAGRMTTRRPG